MTFKRLLGIVGALCAIAVLTGSVGAGAARTPTKHAIDLSTNAAVKQYLRSLGMSPRGVVIQRGARNYAGPHCPGNGWTCTRSQKVVQIATRHPAGARSFLTTTTPTNVARCLRVTGSDQLCVVVQSAGNGVANSAQVDEVIGQTGQTLQGKQQAQITQISTNGANSVQLNQVIGQLSATLAGNVSQSQTTDQAFSISQTSNTGLQSIKVNQVSGQLETAPQANTGTQFADGSLVGHVTQSSGGVSTAKISQIHNPTLKALGPNVEQTVVDPFKCCATQSGNPNNSLNLTQSGTVKTSGDPTPDISAIYEADCQSSGNCTVTQTQNTNGTVSTNTQSGSTVSTTFNCTGTTCTTPTITFPVVNGSFEADTFSYNGTLDLGGSNPLTGWTTLSNGTYPWGLPYPNVFTAGPTPYGNQWVIVGDYGNGGTWIEQTLNGLTPGHTYNLNFAAASEATNGGGQSLLGVSFPSGSSTPGQTIAAPLTTVNYWDTWASFSVSFTASNSSVTFRFTGLAGSLDPGIDNVSITG